MTRYEFEFGPTDRRERLRRGAELRTALCGLLGQVHVDLVSRGAPTRMAVEVRTGIETAVGSGAHNLLRDTWQIGGGARKSLFLAVFDQARTTVLSRGLRVDIPAGHLFLASSRQPFTVIQEGACRWHVVRIDASAIQLPEAIVDQVLYRPYELGRHLRLLIENVIPATDSPGPGGRPAVDVVGFDHYVTGLAELILRSVHDADHDLPADAVRRRQVERYITRNLTDTELSVSVIAAAHAVSRRRLYQLFGGTGVAGFLRQARVGRAKALLADPAYRNHGIGQIAQLVGIRSPAHFSRLFREATGRSPLEFRRNSTTGLALGSVRS
ncbi:helix-turn-helix transcriptional regulator [Solihabitans fulvus]|nr:helix-turn-helix transcriptional regulator [Solihabitans fulvus]